MDHFAAIQAEIDALFVAIPSANLPTDLRPGCADPPDDALDCGNETAVMPAFATTSAVVRRKG